jgi:hypothetical protein
MPMNDPQLFRRRRLDRIVEEEARRAGGDDEASATARAGSCRGRPLLLEMLWRTALEERIVEAALARGAVEVAPCVWQMPYRPDGVA